MTPKEFFASQEGRGLPDYIINDKFIYDKEGNATPNPAKKVVSFLVKKGGIDGIGRWLLQWKEDGSYWLSGTTFLVDDGDDLYRVYEGKSCPISKNEADVIIAFCNQPYNSYEVNQ